MSFVLRSAEARDLPGVFRLARHLDSYNLPADRPRLRRLIRDSESSFRGRSTDNARRRYLFVLENEASGELAGCSLILAKHGTPGLPHLFLSSFVEKRVSRTLRKTVEHRCLRLGSTEDGPTEVGGLVLLPRYRGRPERLGHWLSWVRFLYVGAHIRSFERYLLAEFLPSFAAKGRSPFWDYFGRKFTGMSYHEADRLSIDNKEFVLSLFPRGTIYQDFFPPEVVKFLGEVGDPSAPAARILRKIGFRFLQQIEPFDGGPYFGALTRDVLPVRRAKQLRVSTVHSPLGRPHLVLSETKTGVRALVTSLKARGLEAKLPADDLQRLRANARDWVWAVPFP